MRRLFLAGLLLRTCLAITLRTSAWIDHESEACRAAAPGEWCHGAVMWAKESGYERHPQWFPGNASQYSLRDFQTLLHQLGQAECSRPCPQGSADPGSAPGLSLLEGSTVDDETYGLSADEFAGVMESSWKPKPGTVALAAQGSSKTHRTGCEDAQPGSMCYHATGWLQAEGLAKHPTWYPSLSELSTRQEVQAVLHALGKAGCPKPCQARVATPLPQSPDDRVLEIDSNGRQVTSEAYELAAPTECGDTVEGEWCYISIMWLKNTGLQSHPDWYPKLTRQSSIADFQSALHNEGKVGCPLPCPSDDAESEEVTTTLGNARAVMSPSAVRVNAELEQCENAKRGSRCYDEITRVINVALPEQPESYPGLTANSNREEVQEHLYLRDSYECGRPCPTVKVDKRHRPHRVKKSAEDMTEKELARYLSQEWDGYVDSDEYTDAASAKENALEEYTNAVSADGASRQNASAEEDAPLPEAFDPALQEPSEAQGPSAGDAAGECHDTSVGELCHQAVTWAMRVGILERPKWYADLSENSTFKEFQAHLHRTRGSLCRMPCPDLPPAPEGDAMTEESVTNDTASPVEAQSIPSVANDTVANAENSTLEEPAPKQITEEDIIRENERLQAEFERSKQEALTTTQPQPEAAPVEPEAVSSDEALPVVDDSTEEANATERNAQANSTVEEPAPQPEAAAVEAEADPRGWLPMVDMDGRLAESAVADANHTEEANATEEEARATEGANRTEEPAPQPEVAAEQAPAQEQPAPQPEPTDPQEALRRENDRLRAEVEALRKPDATAVQANSAAEAPAPQPEAPAPQPEARTSEELLPWVNADGLEANASEEEAQVQVSASAAEEQNATAEAEPLAPAAKEEQNSTAG